MRGQLDYKTDRSDRTDKTSSKMSCVSFVSDHYKHIGGKTSEYETRIEDIQYKKLLKRLMQLLT